MQTKKEEATLNQLILETIKKENPENVEELIEILHTKSSESSKSTVLKHIKKLAEEEKITLTEETAPKRSLWFWPIIAVTIITNILVFQVSEQSVLIPIRSIIGYLFCFFIPGYCAIKVLFPKKELDIVETAILSIALSLAIIPLVGLTVNFVIGSIALQPIMFSLSLLVFTLALTAYLKHR